MLLDFAKICQKILPDWAKSHQNDKNSPNWQKFAKLAKNCQSAQWFVLSQKRTFKVHLSIVRVPEDIQKCTIHLCKAFSMLKNIFAYLKVLLSI